MTKTAERDGFNSACEAEGMEGGRSFAPFLEFKKEVEGWVIGTISEGKAVTYVPKKGKNKGKKQTGMYYPFTVTKSGMKSAEEGKEYTISPSGLLGYQLEKGRPAMLSFPCLIAIKYLGLDSEDRHQTDVRWPSKS